MSLYENGTLVDSTPATGDINYRDSDMALGVAKGPTGTPDYYGGYLDDMRIYTHALTPEEIQALHDATK